MAIFGDSRRKMVDFFPLAGPFGRIRGKSGEKCAARDGKSAAEKEGFDLTIIFDRRAF